LGIELWLGLGLGLQFIKNELATMPHLPIPGLNAFTCLVS